MTITHFPRRIFFRDVCSLFNVLNTPGCKVFASIIRFAVKVGSDVDLSGFNFMVGEINNDFDLIVSPRVTRITSDMLAMKFVYSDLVVSLLVEGGQITWVLWQTC